MQHVFFPWFQDSWFQLQEMQARLPHALLFYGQQGIGKTYFVEKFAQSLLCQALKSNGLACDVCLSCSWFSQSNHPDYRLICPEILNSDILDKHDNISITSNKRTNQISSKEIKVDQIRSLRNFINISTHRSGMRIVMLYPVKALNIISCNALLKMLEEPTPETIFLLITNSLHDVLPTVLSRCQRFCLRPPIFNDALTWLKSQEINNADMWLSMHGGSPLIALHAAKHYNYEIICEFLNELSCPTIDGILTVAENLQKIPIVDLVSWQQRWLYDLLTIKLSNLLRYYPRYKKELKMLSTQVDVMQIIHATKNMNARCAIMHHPLLPRLFIEEMMLDYLQLFKV